MTRQSVAASTQDYGAVAQAVVSSGAGAVYYAGYDAQAALFAKALKAASFKGIAMGGDGDKSTRLHAERRLGR